MLELKNKDTDRGYTFIESVMYKIFITHKYPVYSVNFRINTKEEIYDIDTSAIISISLNPIKWEGSKHLTGATWEEFLEWERFIRNNAPSPDWSKHKANNNPQSKVRN